MLHSGIWTDADHQFNNFVPLTDNSVPFYVCAGWLNSHVISFGQSASPHSIQWENGVNKIRDRERWRWGRRVAYTRALPEIGSEL